MEIIAITDKLNKIFRETFYDDSIQLRPEMKADDIVGWDSLNHARILLRVEKEFGLSFDIEEIATLTNVGELIDLVHRKSA